MRILDGIYVYPWFSYEENNCNAIFLDGEVPTLIDPGHAHLLRHVIEGMQEDGIEPRSVRLLLCTHGHPDHVEAFDNFDEAVLRGISKEEFKYLTGEGRDLFLASGNEIPKKAFHLFLKEGRLNLGRRRIRVIETPGHSPGSICLYLEDEKVLISGDTVFYMGVGRIDLPGGDLGRLKRSIERLSKLPAEYLIPGHGELLKGRKTLERNFSLILREFF